MSTPRPVLVVDFGAQYAQLIARRVREARVYSEIVPHSMSVAEMLARDPAAIVLSGGPASVYEPGAPQVDPALFDAGVPMLGICYGFQAMARALGETAPLIMVGAVTGFLATRPGILTALGERFTSLPTLVFLYVKKPEEEFQQLAAATILVLMVLIFVVNLAAILLRNRYERKW